MAVGGGRGRGEIGGGGEEGSSVAILLEAAGPLKQVGGPLNRLSIFIGSVSERIRKTGVL